VLIGDSHVTDVAPRRQVTKLGPRLRASGVDVETRARGGATSRDTVREASAALDCDWIIYSLGTNDAAPWKQVPLEEFIANYERLLRSTSGPAQLVLGNGPVVESGWVGERTNHLMSTYAEAARRVADHAGAKFVALADVLTAADLANDGVHLNDDGYAKLAEIVLGVIAPPVRNTGGSHIS